MTKDVIWVDTDAGLADVVDACGAVVALDTEFQRTNTFFPIAGLYQLESDGQIWLIDPLAIEDFGSFVEMLEDPRVTKVMHACSEDLELLRHHLGAVPRGLIDTQFAYAYLSDRYSISHGDLVEQMCGVQLSSSQTRSNWLRRPLSEGQMRYAADDVRYLAEIYAQIRASLEDLGRWSWFEEDMTERAAYELPDPARYYHGISRAWQLAEDELARLQALCDWRERTAMQRDLPRRRLVWDEHLFSLARQRYLDVEGVADALPAPIARRYAEEIAQVHAQAQQPVEPVEKPLTQAEGKVLKRLRETGVAASDRLRLAPELVARKRDLEALYRHFRRHRSLDARHRGWRLPVVGEAYGALLAEQD